ncbi:DUF1102 domain-containing protein [Thermococcus piezophilus]|uniref:DUF1102 domain-containing protein n=1 Tax=Thermococcus piezophilus TaxID=1712654 RepID=UPI001F384128|nr:DUF1102 domain-containing protein [Thermococcus piezophilus]
MYIFEDAFLIENNQSETSYYKICVRISSDSAKIGFFTDSFDGSWSQVIEAILLANESMGGGYEDRHQWPHPWGLH